MKTPRTRIHRLAIAAGALLLATQAMAAAPREPAPVKANTPEARIFLATLRCTRVGTRMVC